MYPQFVFFFNLLDVPRLFFGFVSFFYFFLVCFFFLLKCRMLVSLTFHLVYQFKYQCCKPAYVGETSCLLHKRISKHLGILAYTVKRFLSPFCLDISCRETHHKTTVHPIPPNKFSALSSRSSSFDF